ncbi:MAG: hypothetical protein N2260_05700 [Syntrophobacterales bacterium]|nr:hypothetical protein [Syntrophobacterales bacterium]
MKSKFLGMVLIVSLIVSVMGFVSQISAILERKYYKSSNGKEAVPLTFSGSSPNEDKRSVAEPLDLTRGKLSISISEAYAQSGKSNKKGDTSEGQKLGDQTTHTSTDTKTPQTLTPKDCAGFLESKARELNEKERSLAEKEATLKALQKDIEDKLARLEEIQKNIEAFKKEQERLKNEKIESLVKIYGSMKPKEASKLLEKLDDDLVVNIISRMTTDQAAKIIANMDVKRAAEISQRLSKTKNAVTQ